MYLQVVTADAEISLAEHLNSTQHGTSTNTTQTPACSHKQIGIASSCETVQVSSDISAFHGLNEPGELQSELSSSGKAAHSQSKASRQHHETPEHQPGHTNATKDDAEDGLNGTWCWEVCSCCLVFCAHTTRNEMCLTCSTTTGPDELHVGSCLGQAL